MGGFMRKMMRKKMHTKSGLLKQMSRDHEDVLQNIELVLVTAYRSFGDVDDHAAHEAVTCALTSETPKTAAVAAMVSSLTRAREMRDDVSDQVWTDCLKVVAQSIRRHSTFAPGETEYFDFVSMFLP